MAEITGEQIASLGAKLEEFAKGLSDAERDILRRMLQRRPAVNSELSDAELESVSGGFSAMFLGGWVELINEALQVTGGKKTYSKGGGTKN
jgi:hypothetical protein